MINSIITLTIVMSLGDGFFAGNCETKLPINNCLPKYIIEYAEIVSDHEFNSIMNEFEQFINASEISSDMLYIDTDYRNSYPLIIAVRLLKHDPDVLNQFTWECYSKVLKELHDKNNRIDKEDRLLRAKIFACESLLRNILNQSFENKQQDIFYDYFEKTFNSPFSSTRLTSIYYLKKMIKENKMYPKNINTVMNQIELLKQSERSKLSLEEKNYYLSHSASRSIIQEIDEVLDFLPNN